MRNGVPWHAAFGMTQAEAEQVRLDSLERAAMSIVMSELEGAKFSWDRMEFLAPEQP